MKIRASVGYEPVREKPDIELELARIVERKARDVRARENGLILARLDFSLV